MIDKIDATIVSAHGRDLLIMLKNKFPLIRFLFGSRAKGTATERSDIDIAVSGVENFDLLAEKIEELPTLYSVDLLNMDTCRNQLLLEDIREYGRKI